MTTRKTKTKTLRELRREADRLGIVWHMFGDGWIVAREGGYEYHAPLPRNRRGEKILLEMVVGVIADQERP